MSMTMLRIVAPIHDTVQWAQSHESEQPPTLHQKLCLCRHAKIKPENPEKLTTTPIRRTLLSAS